MFNPPPQKTIKTWEQAHLLFNDDDYNLKVW